jgi:hypothetical protein
MPRSFSSATIFGDGRLRDAGEVALDVGHEDRHAALAERLRHRLQGHGLAGAGRAGDQAVPVRHRRQELAQRVAASARRMASSMRDGSREGCDPVYPAKAPRRRRGGRA